MIARLVPGALGVALLVLAGGCSSAPDGPAAATSIIGLDGADWRNVLPLVRQGKLPHLAALKRAGTAGVMLTNPNYDWSPVLWTSIATGKLPDKHGVTSFMTAVPGLSRKIPTPSTERRCRALWNLFSERGKSVGFVGWWVTWPAEPVNGFMVTDHFSVSRFDLDRDYEKGLKDPRYAERQTYPEELLREIEDLKVSRGDVHVSDFARFADLPPSFAFPAHFSKFDLVSEFAIAHSVDRTHFAAGRKLLAERRPELFGIFLQGIDIMQHYFWEFMDPEGVGTNPSRADRAAYGEAIERYYEFMDGLVGELIGAGGDGRSVLLVSDHGFRPSTDRWEEKNISGEHRRQSLFLWAGPGVKRSEIFRGFEAVDVTPTLLAYHGMPVADDMDGEPALGALTGQWLAARPLETIDTYEVGEWQRGELPERSVSRELEERIEALGYIDN